MTHRRSRSSQPRARLVLAVAGVAMLAAGTAAASATITRISTDPYANVSSQHATEVEPDSFSFGSTIVMATQVGRFTDGGSSNIGWSTSTDSGSSWTNGFLPRITVHGSPAGRYARVSDPSVAYDAMHGVWMISSLALDSTVSGAAVLTSRSTDGGLTWSDPMATAVAGAGNDFDKNWIACDNTPASPFYGNCYTEFDDFGQGNLIRMSTSTDGGATWGSLRSTANSATGLGGQPVVQPNGTVVVPIANAFETAILAFVSTSGGANWSSPVTISTVKDHAVAGGLRSGPLPSAEIDGAGNVYVAWQDCRFVRSCKANDIVMSTSTNGTTWSSVRRIPIADPIANPKGKKTVADRFIPGLAVDQNTSGATAHLALAYYFYPDAACSASTCKLDVGYVSSLDGGTTWSSVTQLAGPMTLSWLPATTQGRMVGDYISTSFSGGLAYAFFAVANAPSGSTFDQAIWTNATGLAAAAGTNQVSETAVAASADHPAPPSAVARH